MPRYYCDYCDTYLTHDSPSVRKQHNAGYKHKANVRGYYQQFEEQQTQSLIDQRVKEHLGQTAAFQQVGGAFHQHLSTMQYKPPISIPVLPPPSLPPPGSTPASLTPPSTVRPPVLPRPSGGPPGFGVAPTFRPPVATGTSSRPAAQPNGLPRPTFTPQGAPGVRTVTSSSAASANGPLPAPPHSGPPGVYHQQVPSSGSHGNYTYTAPSVGLSGGFISQRPNITATQTSTPTLAATPTPTSTPNPNSIYSSQQASGVAPPPGLANQGSYPYAQGPSRSIQPTTNSYGPPPPGAPVLYQT